MKHSLKTAGKRALTFALCALLIAQTLSGALMAGAAPERAALAAAQTEPKETVTSVPAKALDQNGKPMDVTVSQYEYTFSSVPTNAGEMAQYKLDSPYKTMALLVMAFRAWTPDNETDCLQMLDYLTDTESVFAGTEEKCPFSQYKPWISALRDRMTQNDKWRYIGNAYLGGATPENNYTPNSPATVTLRQSVYDPYAKADEWAPEQKQVLIFFPGADNERYCLFAQDDNGNWKVFRRSWINLLADVKASAEDAIYPPEVTRSESPANPQTEPTVKKEAIPAKAAGIDENGDPIVIDTTVEQYTFTFSTVPKTYEDIVQYKLDSPYKAMALLFMAYRAWTPDNPDDCLQMMDYLTNTKYDSGKKDAEGHKLAAPCSQYEPWKSFVKDRMTQNNKYRYIGDAYLGGAAPANDYKPNDPITVTVRQSVYDPYKDAEGESPELKQVLIHIAGADNDRYSLFYQDERGDWRVFSDNWKGLLADVQKPVMDILMPPETVRPATYKNPQVEPVETVFDIPAKAPGVDDNGESIIMDVTVKQHAFTFSTIPACYEDIIQYKLDSPYKTMALMIMAFRTWTPQNKTDCLQMMDYLTNTDIDSYKTDANGRKLSKKFSEHQFWTDFVRDRMTQNDKWRYIGNAYLDGAMPSNDYAPTEPYTVTVRESVYNPYKPSEGHLTDPTLYQVLTTIPGADNDRYSLFYQDQRGDWRVFGDNWKGLLVDVKTPSADIPLPPEVVKPASPANPQTEPALGLRQNVADSCQLLRGKYRLLAIDSCNHIDGKDGVTPQLLAWTDKQVQQAKQDGKQLIVIMHHNFLEHITLQAKLMSNFIIDPAKDMKTYFLDRGIRYVFTGHMHGHDIKAYTDKAGRKVYDILTTTLTGYPCAYRALKLNDQGLDVRTIRMKGVDPADLPQSGYTPELLAELTDDLESFAVGCFRMGYSLRKDAFFSEKALRGILAKFGGKSIQSLIDTIYPVFFSYISLPIYTQDAADGKSLQAIAEELGLHLPQTDDRIVTDTILYFIRVLFNGDENVNYNDERIILFMQCVYAAMYRTLQEVHADQRAAILSDFHANFKSTALPFAVSGAGKAALAGVKDDALLEGVLLIASPAIELFSKDNDDTPDNDAFLPDKDDAPQTVLQTVLQFLRVVWKYITQYVTGWRDILTARIFRR